MKVIYFIRVMCPRFSRIKRKSKKIAKGNTRVVRTLRLLLHMFIPLLGLFYAPTSDATRLTMRQQVPAPETDDIKINLPPKRMVLENADDWETKISDSNKTTHLPLCEIPSDLGPLSFDGRKIKMEIVEKKYPEVHWGGRYSPPNCTARHKVAIIVPFRDRMHQLSTFLNHMHRFLMRQQLEYGIFIIEQEGTSLFNRAKLMNVGYVESQKQKAGGWQCFIFHDIDLLPLDERNLYSCPKQPRHLAIFFETEYEFYHKYFGGVSAMTNEQFEVVNGFSNNYWGWGGEDDDMSYRIEQMGYYLARFKMSISRYVKLNHKKAAPNKKRRKILLKLRKTFQTDGLITLEYEVKQITYNHLYTHVIANIDEPRSNFAKLLFYRRR